MVILIIILAIFQSIMIRLFDTWTAALPPFPHTPGSTIHYWPLLQRQHQPGHLQNSYSIPQEQVQTHAQEEYLVHMLSVTLTATIRVPRLPSR